MARRNKEEMLADVNKSLQIIRDNPGIEREMLSIKLGISPKIPIGNQLRINGYLESLLVVLKRDHGVIVATKGRNQPKYLYLSESSDKASA